MPHEICRGPIFPGRISLEVALTMGVLLKCQIGHSDVGSTIGQRKMVHVKVAETYINEGRAYS